jgi:16S rRNA (guanine527-N7)-methyltransferase
MKHFSEEYRQILFGEFSTLNLTRISEKDEFYDKQIVDSIFPFQEIDLFKNELGRIGKHIDVGFGGGFPLVPLAKLNPDVSFIGFEARRKKAEAVFQIAQRLGLKNVKTYHSRIEEIYLDEPVTISLKAVGKIQDFLEKINPGKEAWVFFYKGPNLQELEKIPDNVRSFHKILIQKYSLPSGQIRHLVVYKSKNVPRRTKKNLVNLSELI